MASRSGIARRQFFAFGCFFLLFGAASYFAMAAVGELHREGHQGEEQREGLRTARELASAVRDQWAQQANTMLAGNQAFLVRYEEERRQVARLTGLIRTYAPGARQRAAIDEMERASAELDAIFLQRIVPTVLTGRAAMKEQYDRAQELAALIATRADGLAREIETPASAVEQHTLLRHRSVQWMMACLAGGILLAAGLSIASVRSMGASIVRFGPVAGSLLQNKKLTSIGRLLGSVAQEIINPLGVIVGYARTLQKKTDTAVAAELKVIEDEALWCQQIVKEIVDLSRPVQHPNERVDLAEVCIDVVKQIQGDASQPSVQVEIEGAGAVLGNAQTLRQVVFNIVKNASEAAGTNGKVRIQIDQSPDGRVAMSVVDVGPAGANHEPRRVEPAVGPKPTDPGLGLAVSQAIARAHGGSIETSLAPEGGAVFILSLPARASEGELA